MDLSLKIREILLKENKEILIFSIKFDHTITPLVHIFFVIFIYNLYKSNDISQHDFCIAKFMKNVYFTKYFLKIIFFNLIGEFRVFCLKKPFIFCQKWISWLQKNPNLPYWASKPAKKRLKKNCWTKTGNLDQSSAVKLL